MPYLHLHDHGWLAVPAELRKQLGLQTGDRLQLEMIERGLQGEESSVVSGMPKEAIKMGAAQLVLPLEKIAAEVIRHGRA